MCNQIPILDTDEAKLDVSILNMHTDELLGTKQLTFRMNETIFLNELIPRAIFHNVSNAYIMVKGT